MADLEDGAHGEEEGVREAGRVGVQGGGRGSVARVEGECGVLVVVMNLGEVLIWAGEEQGVLFEEHLLALGSGVSESGLKGEHVIPLLGWGSCPCW